jgi:catechol 2,3-dioxygenase-like lactoylglutathione lyase family enzyme
VTLVWYRVRDLDDARAFYTGKLGFAEIYRDEDGRWARLQRDAIEVGLTEGEPETEGAVATLDVEDVKTEADRLRGEGVEVGTVVELHGEMRLLDVFDTDGNRIQLAEELSGG